MKTEGDLFSSPARLKGQIERITYTNPDTGYTVAKIRVSGQRRLVTAVGKFISPSPGEKLIMKGRWSTHPRYGRQFKVESYKKTRPASVYGIEKYLGSGLIKGIGPVMAKKIVRKFGHRSLDIIENDIEKLSEIEGIGKKRIGMIKKAWDEQREIREVMIFLRSHDVSSGYASKIFKRYGSNSIKVVKENPYRLAEDIFGIGFVVADKIAAKLGIERDSLIRAEAGVLYTLNRLSDEGHLYCPRSQLIDKCTDLLKISPETIEKALGSVSGQEKVVVEEVEESGEEAVYLAKYHFSENSVARQLRALNSRPVWFKKIDTEKALARARRHMEVDLAEKQVEALKCAFQNKVMVITGGPGTGKTTIIKAVLEIFSSLKVNVMLAAPTGRAAKRMSEAAGREARTIHRMLEYSPGKGFRKNSSNPLGCGLLIVDEASMIDMVLMHHLLKAVPPDAGFILVGDVNQLPSVGPGNVLKDIISSQAVPVIELNEIFRQAQESLIVVNAHRINRGQMPVLEDKSKGLSDFYFIQQPVPVKVLNIILELAKNRIPRRFGLDPVDDIQVLSPMHRGVIGAQNLNVELQKALNPSGDAVNGTSRDFRLGDKVMQLRNNYEKEVFNGDMGRIKNIDHRRRDMVVSFGGREVLYEWGETSELTPAYAVSVHKSQGSEYPAVIIPVLTQHYVLLQRNLIYTAVTRARKLLVMVGTKKALAIAIKNNKTAKRFTSLETRLKSGTS